MKLYFTFLSHNYLPLFLTSKAKSFSELESPSVTTENKNSLDDDLHYSFLSVMELHYPMRRAGLWSSMVQYHLPEPSPSSSNMGAPSGGVHSTVKKVYEQTHILQHWFSFKIWGKKDAWHLFVVVCSISQTVQKRMPRSPEFLRLNAGSESKCLLTPEIFMVIPTDPWRNAFFP